MRQREETKRKVAGGSRSDRKPESVVRAVTLLV